MFNEIYFEIRSNQLSRLTWIHLLIAFKSAWYHIWWDKSAWNDSKWLVVGQGSALGMGRFAAAIGYSKSNNKDGRLVPPSTVLNNVNNANSHESIHSFSCRFLTELDYTNHNSCIYHCTSIASACVGKLQTLCARIANKTAVCQVRVWLWYQIVVLLRT